MLKRFAACMGFAAICTGSLAMAGDTPPIAGSVSTFSRIEPAQASPSDGFRDSAGRALRLADFRGKVVLLNFWAMWCAPCKGEMASLDRLQAKLGGADFTVLAISIDDSEPAVAFTYVQYDISHLGIYLAQSDNFPMHMGIHGVPTSFLVNRDGQVVGILKGATQWDTPEALRLVRYYLKRGSASVPASDDTPTATEVASSRQAGLGLSSH